MRLPRAWHRAASFIVLLGLDLSLWAGPSTSGGGAFVQARPWILPRKRDLREQARDLWNHGFNNYMDYGELEQAVCLHGSLVSRIS